MTVLFLQPRHHQILRVATDLRAGADARRICKRTDLSARLQMPRAA